MEYGPVDFVADIQTICEHNCDDCNRCLGDIRDICNAGYGRDALGYITPSTVSIVRAIADTIRNMKSIPNLKSAASADTCMHTAKHSCPSAMEFIEYEDDALNSAAPSQNKPEGEWIPDKYDPEFKFECSCCHWTGEHPYKYCPECGSKMKEAH